MKPTGKYGVAQKTVFKTKGPYRVLDKATPRSYWLQRLHFFEGLGRPIIKVKESVARMEKIPSTMVIHKHVDDTKTRFATMSGPLVNNLMEKWLGLIIIGTYQ